MIPVRHKHDILQIAARGAPSRACARAVWEGAVVIEQVPEHNGWVVGITSRRGRVWKLRVSVDADRRTYIVENLT